MRMVCAASKEQRRFDGLAWADDGHFDWRPAAEPDVVGASC